MAKSAPKGFVGNFRSGVNFAERLIKNIKIQTKYIWKKGNQMYKAIRDWHRSRYGTWNKTRAVITALCVLLICSFLYPILLFWAALKSI